MALLLEVKGPYHIQSTTSRLRIGGMQLEVRKTASGKTSTVGT